MGRAGLRVGVAGAGRAFERLYLPALRMVPELEAAAIADPRPGDGAGTGIRRWPSLEAMIGAEPLDGVLVLSPPAFHAEQAGQALAAGLHVLCEKPAALRPAETEAWPADALHRFAGAYTRRAWPAYLRARRQGGRAWAFELETNGAAWGATTQEPLTWDLLPHAIDLAEWVTGSSIAGVRGIRRNARAVSGVFDLKNGGEFRWRVADGSGYRERLARDGRAIVRRPGRLPWLERLRTPADIAGVREVLRAWARFMAGGERPALLADAAAVRRHAAIIESVEREVGAAWAHGR
jgi:predicted dehydrogenase